MAREAKPCPFYGMPCEYVPMAEKVDAAAARIEQLEAEVKAWQGHAKTAIWSDSEECKVLSSEVERLLKSRNRWAEKYNDLLKKRRAEDGYDVYAAAREEYRKKIAEQAAEIERLRAELQNHGQVEQLSEELERARAALREIVAMDEVAIVEFQKGDGWLHQRVARAALGEKP